VLGGGTLLLLGLDAVGPLAAQLPRWVTIGAAGLLLLWLGTTAERRLARLRELREQFKESRPAPNRREGRGGSAASSWRPRVGTGRAMDASRPHGDPGAPLRPDPPEQAAGEEAVPDRRPHDRERSVPAAGV
jgi:hypothetical protein